MYYSTKTGLTYHYEGKYMGCFTFLTTGKGSTGSFHGYEESLLKLELQEKR